MATFRVDVESADHDPTSLPFKLGVTTASVKNGIREYLCVTGGGCLQKKQKESSSADDFTIITGDDEAISSDYDYKFIRGKSGIGYSSYLQGTSPVLR